MHARICDRVTAAKCLEVQQICWEEWTVFSCLPPTHLGTNPSVFPSARICAELCWVAAQLSHFTLTPSRHTCTHTHTMVRYLPGLVLSLWQPYFLFLFFLLKMLWARWQSPRLYTVHTSVAKPRRNSPKVIFCSISTKQDLPVTNVSQLICLWLPTRGFLLGGVYVTWKKWDWNCFWVLGGCM